MALCENTAWIQELRDKVTMAHVLELSGGQGLLLTSLLSSSYKNALMSWRNFETKSSQAHCSSVVYEQGRN